MADGSMGFALLLLLLLVISPARGGAGDERFPLSAGPSGVEAIAISPDAIDVYLPRDNPGAQIARDGFPIGEAPAGARVYRDSGLRPATLYTYTVTGIGDAPIAVAEQTFPSLPDQASYDVIVIGATASGTAAAVSAARMGARVALVEETNRAGGMAAHGLGSTDIRSPARSNGFFDEFRARVAAHYGSGNGLRYEPRVANAVMKSILYAEPRVSFFRRTRADCPILTDGRITGVRVTDLNTCEAASLCAPVVIDATDTADIAAAAGVEFRIPREARSAGEPHAGVIYYDGANDCLLPGSTGEADSRVQSYAYLMIVRDYGDVDMTIPEPPNYNPEDYRHSPLWAQTWAYTSGRLPNGKFEINQHPWGIDLPGINYGYPYANRAERARIDELYKWRALGYLRYVQTQLGMKSIGLADDEFVDNDNFPTALYVREARRMVGQAVLTEADVTCAADRAMPDTALIGDYPMDSHATQNVLGTDSRDRGEGEFWLVNQTPVYRAPLGVIIPQDRPGLLVSQAVSATHIAFGTLRMEPVRMSLGQAAGTLAALAVRFNTSPECIPTAIVQDKLLGQKAYITWFDDVTGDSRHFRAIQFLGARGFFAYGGRFSGEENLYKGDACRLMDHLVKIETLGPNLPNKPFSPDPNAQPITRAEFAEILVNAKMQIDPSWQPQPTSASSYADLAPGTPVADHAETLFRHRIDTRTWAGPPPTNECGQLLFHPQSPITRADAAQAIWLAHRAVALRYR